MTVVDRHRQPVWPFWHTFDPLVNSDDGMLAVVVVVVPVDIVDAVVVVDVAHTVEGVVAATGEVARCSLVVGVAIVDVVHDMPPPVDASLPPCATRPHVGAALPPLAAFANFPVVASIAPAVVVVALQFVDVAPPLVAPQRVVDALLHRVAIARPPIVSVPLPHVAFSQWLPVVVVQILAALRLPLYAGPNLPPIYDVERLHRFAVDDR